MCSDVLQIAWWLAVTAAFRHDGSRKAWVVVLLHYGCMHAPMQDLDLARNGKSGASHEATGAAVACAREVADERCALQVAAESGEMRQTIWHMLKAAPDSSMPGGGALSARDL
jgi:hypothetical protein